MKRKQEVSEEARGSNDKDEEEIVPTKTGGTVTEQEQVTPFSLPELLENILSFCNSSTLRALRLVNRLANDMICSSAYLKQNWIGQCHQFARIQHMGAVRVHPLLKGAKVEQPDPVPPTFHHRTMTSHLGDVEGIMFVPQVLELGRCGGCGESVLLLTTRVARSPGYYHSFTLTYGDAQTILNLSSLPCAEERRSFLPGPPPEKLPEGCWQVTRELKNNCYGRTWRMNTPPHILIDGYHLFISYWLGAQEELCIEVLDLRDGNVLGKHMRGLGDEEGYRHAPSLAHVKGILYYVHTSGKLVGLTVPSLHQVVEFKPNLDTPGLPLYGPELGQMIVHPYKQGFIFIWGWAGKILAKFLQEDEETQVTAYDIMPFFSQEAMMGLTASEMVDLLNNLDFIVLENSSKDGDDDDEHVRLLVSVFPSDWEEAIDEVPYLMILDLNGQIPWKRSFGEEYRLVSRPCVIGDAGYVALVSLDGVTILRINLGAPEHRVSVPWPDDYSPISERLVSGTLVLDWAKDGKFLFVGCDYFSGGDPPLLLCFETENMQLKWQRMLQLLPENDVHVSGCHFIKHDKAFIHKNGRLFLPGLADTLPCLTQWHTCYMGESNENSLKD